jgi:hypothetical protein
MFYQYGKEEDHGTFHANSTAAQCYSKLKGKRQFSYSKEGIDVVYLVPKGFLCVGPCSINSLHETAVTL